MISWAGCHSVHLETTENGEALFPGGNKVTQERGLSLGLAYSRQLLLAVLQPLPLQSKKTDAWHLVHDVSQLLKAGDIFLPHPL